MTQRITGVVLAFVTAVISGVSVYLNSDAVKHFHDQTVYTTAKNGVAGVLLIGIWAAAGWRAGRAGPRVGGGDQRRPVGPRQMLAFLALAIVGGSVPFALFFQGLAAAQATQAAFLHKTLIVWVALLAVPLLRERVGWPHLVAILLLLVGQALLAGRAGTVAFGRGEAMILAATLLWSVEVVYVKRLLRRFSSHLLAVVRMAGGTALLVAWLALTGKFHQLIALDAAQWRWVIVTGVLLTGYVATWYAALARAQAVDVTAVLVFGAVITALLSAMFGSGSLKVPVLVAITVGCGLIAWAALRYPPSTRRPVVTASPSR